MIMEKRKEKKTKKKEANAMGPIGADGRIGNAMIHVAPTSYQRAPDLTIDASNLHVNHARVAAGPPLLPFPSRASTHRRASTPTKFPNPS